MLEESTCFTCKGILILTLLGDAVLKNHEQTLANCINAGPLTVFLYLRITKLAVDSKQIRQNWNPDLHNGCYYVNELSELCMLDIKSSQCSDNIRFLTRITSFFTSSIQSANEDSLSLRLKKVQRLRAEILPSPKMLYNYIKLCAKSTITEKVSYLSHFILIGKNHHPYNCGFT